MNKICTLEESIALIQEGRTLVIAGFEELLQKLPKGKWIGGSGTCFLDNKEGGTETFERLFVWDFTDLVSNARICEYKASELSNIPKDEYENGFSYIILPFFSEVHSTYGLEAFNMPDLFKNPIFGWVAGIIQPGHAVTAENVTSFVFNGETGEMSREVAIVLHCQLPDHKQARIETITPYATGEGDELTFDEMTFSTETVNVNGKKRKAVEYFLEQNKDPRIPLFADMYGAEICVVPSTANLKPTDTHVSFGIPVIPGIIYKFGKMEEDYDKAFQESMPKDTSNICSCTCCYVNYTLLGLKGKRLGELNGLFAFGEIAYILMNQSTVNLYIDDKE